MALFSRLANAPASLLLLFATVLVTVSCAVQLQDSSFAMSLRVAKDEFERSCKLLFDLDINE
jgi:hypothetical protein